MDRPEVDVTTPLQTILDALEAIAPLRAAEDWDNVGLLVGDPQQTVNRAMLTIDYSPDVAAEAAEAKCELVIAYHPPLFSAIKRITSAQPTDLIFDAIRRGVAIYSPHTSLDAAEGGTNDVIADGLSLADRRPLRVTKSTSRHLKLVTFVPADAVEKVGDALFIAGAGKIGGKYDRCSFRSAGTGTFRGDANSNPTIGTPGRFEQVPEVKFETVFPIERVEAVLAALRKSHPYEEPAFDLVALVAPPEANGQGRLGKLPGEATLEMTANLLKRIVGVDRLLISGDRDRIIRRVAICAGAGGSMLADAIAAKADLFITGELRHHDVVAAGRAGVSVIATLHTNSERGVLTRLAERLRLATPGVEYQVSQSDRDPFEIL